MIAYDAADISYNLYKNVIIQTSAVSWQTFKCTKFGSNTHLYMWSETVTNGYLYYGKFFKLYFLLKKLVEFVKFPINTSVINLYIYELKLPHITN
jgi:hypothetical protein